TSSDRSPRARRLSSRLRARRSPRRKRSRRLSSIAPRLRGWMLAQEGDDVGQRRAGAKDTGDTHLEKLWDIALGNDAADKDADVPEPGLAKEREDAGHERHVRAAEETEANPVGVLVGNGADDCFRCLPQSSVDDLHAGVAQAAGNDLDAAVVAVEADLGE